MNICLQNECVLLGKTLLVPAGSWGGLRVSEARAAGQGVGEGQGAREDAGRP